MKKTLFFLLVLVVSSTYCQVIINGESSEVPLKSGDLDVRGNIKIDSVQPTIYDIKSGTNTVTIIKKNRDRLFFDKTNTENNRFIAKADLLKNRLRRLVFHIQLNPETNHNEEGYNVVLYDTKIPYDKYKVVLGTCNMIVSSDPASNKIAIIKANVQSVKEAQLIEIAHGTNPSTWGFSVNYTSNNSSNIKWRVEVLAINKYFVDTFTGSNSFTSPINYEQPPYQKITGGVGIGTDSPKQTLDVAESIRCSTPTIITDNNEKRKLTPLFIDEEGIVRIGTAERLAYYVNLNIKLLSSSITDFIYYLRLGLDPKKYTPIMANYMFLCSDESETNFRLPLLDGKQPVLNNSLSISNRRKNKTGPEDWVLYMDYAQVDPKECPEKTVWKVGLLVFYNRYIKDVTIKNSPSEENSEEHPSIVNTYDNTLKGYKGEIGVEPVLDDY